ncbi:hypothetical protein [Streptomyces sp. NPDC021212]|uniref:hypothetical protein n=1 Tax=Streptomyces sp. NPDC021212 TaxID=3365118 RepID=UPI0037A28125
MPRRRRERHPTGTGEADNLYGDDGNDILRAGAENDYVYGGKGTDTLSGGPGSNKVYQD